ncbi:MAG TPA: hypothetical protein VHV77_07180, partial [Pirellulales bacterium]|nr:hypothetical protein [Pirellulales bacterium]
GRQRQHAALSFLLNSVSRTRAIAIQPRTDDGWLVRIDLAAYSDLRNRKTYDELFAAWEKVARDDPYFHIRTQVTSDGKNTKEVTVDGGWVGLKEAQTLREITGSFGAVLRVDYLVARIGGDAYYDFAGIPDKEVDFFKLFGVDPAIVASVSADSAANLFRSNVTRKPRRIIEYPGPNGPVFQTKDVDAESPDRDPFRNPINVKGQRFNFQASEFFAMGANKLWRVALYDAAGNRQDSVPDKVAKDFAGDGIIAPMVTCFRCHERNGGLGALQPFHDDQTELIARVGLSSYIPEVAQKIGEVYDPARLDVSVSRAREDYTAAVDRATAGLSPAEATDALVALYSGYVDLPVTADQAAAELALEPSQLPEALVNSHDVMTLAVRSGHTVNRKAWESAFGDAALLAEQFRQRAESD